MKYPDVCEIVTGLTLKGKYPPNAVPTKELLEPYDDMIRSLQKDPSVTSEKLIQKFGLSAYQAAEQAVAALNGTKQKDWLGILHDSYGKYMLGALMEKQGRKLMEGKEADYSQITNHINSLDQAATQGILLSEVSDDFVPTMPSGFEPWDTHLGGSPVQGLTTWGAKSKSGKTSLMIDETFAFVEHQDKKDAAVFSLEMIAPEFKNRCKELKKPKRLMNRIVIWDGILSAADVESEIGKEQLRRQTSGKRPIGRMSVDFADLMVQDEENSESVFANIYRTMSRIAKTLVIPVTLLSQLNGAYTGGLPKPYHLRYTRLAEALSWRVLMLYNPNTDWADISDVDLPIDPGFGFILAWASRGGFGKHPGAGAIRMPWDGGRGWGKKSAGWYPLIKIE